MLKFIDDIKCELEYHKYKHIRSRYYYTSSNSRHAHRIEYDYVCVNCGYVYTSVCNPLIELM